MMLTYTTVICTRNRPEALALTLPLHIAEPRAPQRVLVVDSSDDPTQNIATIKRLGATAPMPVEHHHTSTGIAHQRNVALSMVDTEIAFLPDDDSVLEAGAMSHIMRIYERDTDALIGGVGAREIRDPFGPLRTEAQTAYDRTFSDRVKGAIAKPRYRFEQTMIGDPFLVVAERKYERLPAAPAWLAEEEAETVPWNTGFRMSFRTEAARKYGFHEPLGRYSLFEDIDVGFHVLDDKMLVATRKAGIYHHKAPLRRAKGRALGAMHVLNRAYVCARSGEGADREVRAAMRRWTRYKLMQYLAGARSKFGRERLAGAYTAARVADELLTTPHEQLEARYLALRHEIFPSE